MGYEIKKVEIRRARSSRAFGHQKGGGEVVSTGWRIVFEGGLDGVPRHEIGSVLRTFQTKKAAARSANLFVIRQKFLAIEAEYKSTH